MPNDPSQHERDRYLSERLDSTLKTVERIARSAGVAPEDAAAVARSAELSGWVRHWYRSKWVPAAVFEAVGVREWEAER